MAYLFILAHLQMCKHFFVWHIICAFDRLAPFFSSRTWNTCLHTFLVLTQVKITYYCFLFFLEKNAIIISKQTLKIFIFRATKMHAKFCCILIWTQRQLSQGISGVFAGLVLIFGVFFLNICLSN